MKKKYLRFVSFMGLYFFFLAAPLCASNMPSPFELGRAIGGNIAGGIREGIEKAKRESAIEQEVLRERNAINQILENINNCNNREDIRIVSGQILRYLSPERQPIAMQILQLKLDELTQN